MATKKLKAKPIPLRAYTGWEPRGVRALELEANRIDLVDSYGNTMFTINIHAYHIEISGVMHTPQPDGLHSEQLIVEPNVSNAVTIRTKRA